MGRQGSDGDDGSGLFLAIVFAFFAMWGGCEGDSRIQEVRKELKEIRKELQDERSRTGKGNARPEKGDGNE